MQHCFLSAQTLLPSKYIQILFLLVQSAVIFCFPLVMFLWKSHLAARKTTCIVLQHFAEFAQLKKAVLWLGHNCAFNQFRGRDYEATAAHKKRIFCCNYFVQFSLVNLFKFNLFNVLGLWGSMGLFSLVVNPKMFGLQVYCSIDSAHITS